VNYGGHAVSIWPVILSILSVILSEAKDPKLSWRLIESGIDAADLRSASPTAGGLPSVVGSSLRSSG